MRKSISLPALICVLAVSALAQGPAVATIKPSDPNVPGYGLSTNAGRFSASGYTVRLLIIYAYDVHRSQVSSGPAWLDSDKYDIVARADEGRMPSPEEWKIMVQKLLADRFGLTFHHEKKTLSVYALTAGKGGSKLTPTDADVNVPPDISFYALGKLGARAATMADFVHSLQRNVLDRPIIDQTGLSGRYNFTLNWVPDEFQFAAVRTPGGPQIPSNTEGADLITAIQQQLGLKLEATKAPADVMVIDRVQRPSEN